MYLSRIFGRRSNLWLSTKAAMNNESGKGFKSQITEEINGELVKAGLLKESLQDDHLLGSLEGSVSNKSLEGLALNTRASVS